jgi:anti-sigma regulatory factor (Ser/Thr protein kinase)
MASGCEDRELVLPADTHAPRAARRAVADWLRRCLDAPALDDVQLVVSELVTNSCLHADVPMGRSIRLSATVVDEVVRLEIRDSGADGTVARRRPDGDGGYGLNIVQAIALRWGIDHADGTTVWCELPARA